MSSSANPSPSVALKYQAWSPQTSRITGKSRASNKQLTILRRVKPANDPGLKLYTILRPYSRLNRCNASLSEEIVGMAMGQVAEIVGLDGIGNAIGRESVAPVSI